MSGVEPSVSQETCTQLVAEIMFRKCFIIWCVGLWMSLLFLIASNVWAHNFSFTKTLNLWFCLNVWPLKCAFAWTELNVVNFCEIWIWFIQSCRILLLKLLDIDHKSMLKCVFMCVWEWWGLGGYDACESLFCVTQFQRATVCFGGCLKPKMHKDRRQCLEGCIKCVCLSAGSVCLCVWAWVASKVPNVWSFLH